MSTDHEERVDAAVARAIGLVLEARLAYWPAFGDERRNGVVHEPEVTGVGHAEERIRRRARAPDRWLRVTAGAAHEVESRADPVLHSLLFREVGQSVGEHLLLVGGQVRQHPAGALRSSPHAGVAGGSELRREALGQSEEHHDRERCQDTKPCSAQFCSGHFCSLREVHGSHGSNEQAEGAQGQCQRDRDC